MNTPVYLLMAAAIVPSCSAPAMADVTSLRAWSAISTDQAISPITGGSADHVVDWVGPNGNAVHLVVQVPVAARQQTMVTVSPPTGDAGATILAAVTQVASGGVVKLTPGVYSIAGDSNWRDPALLLSGLSDVTITGSGATLLFTRSGYGIRIADSNRVLITGVTLRYADSAMVLAQISTDSSGPMVVPAVAVSGAFKIYQATVFNAATQAYPPGGTRIIIAAGATLTPDANGRIAAGPLAPIPAGSAVALKLGYYLGSAIDVLDTGAGAGSSDIVLDNVAIENGRGTGVTVTQMNRGFAFINSRIGPADLANLPESVAFDGVHIVAAAGDILIQNNVIEGTGDDAINLASPILTATGSVSASDVSVLGAQAIHNGDKLGLFDSNLAFLGSAGVVTRSRTDANNVSDVTLDAAAGADRASYVRDLRYRGNRYAVMDNVVGHCVCHGVLAQGPNGQVSGNKFDYLRFNAIRVLTSSGWLEGAGAANVLVSNNQISNTGEDGRVGFTWAAITVYGELSGYVAASAPLSNDIDISNNTITNVANGCISVQSAINVTGSGNSCGTGSSAVVVDTSSTQDVSVAD